VKVGADPTGPTSERTGLSPLIWCGADGCSERAGERDVELAAGEPTAANEDLGEVVDLLPTLTH
jgi:hypothetical protein